MKSKWRLITLVSVVFVLMFSTSAYAFQDIKGHSAEQSINKLQAAGIVSGVDADHFDPEGLVTFAQGVQMIVKGLDLNLNFIKFVKKPNASDYFTKVSDKEWYANSFMVAQLNSMQLDKDVNPNQTMTREQFVHLVMNAINKKGEFPLMAIYINIADGEEISKEYRDSVQAMTILNIIQLDKSSKFNPKKELTRGQAAIWLNGAMEFVKSHVENPNPGDLTQIDKDVAMVVEKLTEGVNKVTVSWGEQPSSGYSIAITGIEFGKNNEAVISYELGYPEPGMSYMTVITYPKSITYIPSQYTPVLKPAAVK